MRSPRGTAHRSAHVECGSQKWSECGCGAPVAVDNGDELACRKLWQRMQGDPGVPWINRELRHNCNAFASCDQGLDHAIVIEALDSGGDDPSGEQPLFDKSVVKAAADAEQAFSVKVCELTLGCLGTGDEDVRIDEQRMDVERAVPDRKPGEANICLATFDTC